MHSKVYVCHIREFIVSRVHYSEVQLYECGPLREDCILHYKQSVVFNRLKSIILTSENVRISLSVRSCVHTCVCATHFLVLFV